ncbi:MAG: hypothetical protein COB02_17515 [Candidatus Cloacimonadota bacterium]|nr:MAG: hypothetical protein COB02_17515 [Candidatus Cloacimonadota bacterium]
MYKIYADYNRVFSNQLHTHLGNKVQHLFYLMNLSFHHKRRPIVYSGSNLDNIFEYRQDVEILTEEKNIDFGFIEESAFLEANRLQKMLNIKIKQSVMDVSVKSYYQYLKELNFLYGKLPERDFMIRGHFWHYDLMPKYEVFNKYILIKNSLLQQVKFKYPSIDDINSIAVHYRGGDFHTHKRDIFKKSIALNPEYYKKSLIKIKKKISSPVFHIFSDELDTILPLFKDEETVVHKDDAFMDWVSIYLSKNVIQSNSSFCWTASLYNKKISIQPEYGYGFNDRIAPVPFGFIHANSEEIKNE